MYGQASTGRLTIQLVSIEMLGARVALAAALVRAFELLVESLAASPALFRGAGTHACVRFSEAVVLLARVALAVPPASARGIFVAGRARSARMLHVRNGFNSNAKVRGMSSVQWQYLGRHGMRRRRRRFSGSRFGGRPSVRPRSGKRAATD